MSRTREAQTLRRAEARCYNPEHPAYEHYGGRGIGIDDRYRGENAVLNLIDDIGNRPSDNHSLDRIDNSKGYVPGNLRWATRKQQARNTRRNRFITHEGETLTLQGWSERKGWPKYVIRNRIKSGWSEAQALDTPWQRQRRSKTEYSLTLNGKTHTITEWAEKTGLSAVLLRQRHSRGWTDEEILTRPVRSWNKRKK